MTFNPLGSNTVLLFTTAHLQIMSLPLSGREPNFSEVIIYTGYAVVQLDEALRYKPGRRGSDSRRNQRNFSLA
jgi:hypothetical protein